jgi:hypothetical protein
VLRGRGDRSNSILSMRRQGPTRVPSCGCDRDRRVCRAWGCGVAAAPSAAQMGEVGHPVRSREDVGDGRYGIVR